MLINGSLAEVDQTFEVVNPSSGLVFAHCPHATQAQADAAIGAADEAFQSWSILSLEKRKEYLLKAAKAIADAKDELAELLVLEQGKPLDAAAGEVDLCIECLNTMAHLDGTKLIKRETVDFVPASDDHEVEIRRVPMGVIAGITPWNFPMFCSVQKWAPSLVLGNTFVHKPSPFTPLTGLRVGALLQNIFPRGVFNVLTGDDSSSFNVGSYLTSHPAIRKISFTGSVPTGKAIMRASADDVKRITLEMGGNDAAIVRADINVKEMAPKVFASAFANTGQVCCAIKRCFVHESVVDEFTREMAACAEAAKAASGDGFTAGVEYGPLNNKVGERNFEGSIRMLVLEQPSPHTHVALVHTRCFNELLLHPLPLSIDAVR
jgi:acyl-CoA reductase-like NAD-dependent aldehyde dehydrogenase